MFIHSKANKIGWLIERHSRVCLEDFDSLKENCDKISDVNRESIEALLSETREFFDKKVEYLKKFNIDDQEINRSLIDSDQLISKINDL